MNLVKLQTVPNCSIINILIITLSLQFIFENNVKHISLVEINNLEIIYSFKLIESVKWIVTNFQRRFLQK